VNEFENVRGGLLRQQLLRQLEDALQYAQELGCTISGAQDLVALLAGLGHPTRRWLLGLSDNALSRPDLMLEQLETYRGCRFSDQLAHDIEAWVKAKQQEESNADRDPEGGVGNVPADRGAVLRNGDVGHP
jgi:hypothetical protein